MTSGEKGVALVTGSSTGIGFETSIAFAQNRYRTFATMRDLSKAEPLQNRVKSEHLLTLWLHRVTHIDPY